MTLVNTTMAPLAPTAHLFEVPIHTQSMAQAQSQLANHLAAWQHGQADTRHVVTLNPEMLIQGEQNPALDQVLKSAEWVIPDGAGAVWALRLLDTPDTERVPGIEFAETALALAASAQAPIAVVGAQPDTLKSACQNLQDRYPGLKIAYQHHGFFNTAEDATILQGITDAQPWLVLAGLGVPRQELWLAEHKHALPGSLWVGVGGSFDVWSGLKKRAPAWMRACHMEWVYRISCEPWRLKRTAKPLPLFVVRVLQRLATNRLLPERR
jgi:N-acetylglucosaminyldiphosphoundecaprenol N-acetyl-beta-D-mannosaminyltransferase